MVLDENSRFGIGIALGSNTAYLHVRGGTKTTPAIRLASGTYLTTAVEGGFEYNGQFSLTPTDATRRFVVLAAASTKVTAAAPYTNDGYITLNINGTDVKVMTTA